MNIFTINIEKDTLQNTNFRNVLFTCPKISPEVTIMPSKQILYTCPSIAGMQVAIMSLNVNEDIGLEKHDDADQFIRIEQGNAEAYIGKDLSNQTTFKLEKDSVIIVPAGTWHNIKNTGNSDLKLYTVYSKAQHADKEINKTKKDADLAEVKEPVKEEPVKEEPVKEEPVKDEQVKDEQDEQEQKEEEITGGGYNKKYRTYKFKKL